RKDIDTVLEFQSDLDVSDQRSPDPGMRIGGTEKNHGLCNINRPVQGAQVDSLGLPDPNDFQVQAVVDHGTYWIIRPALAYQGGVRLVGKVSGLRITEVFP